MSDLRFIAINIGNTRTQIAAFAGSEVLRTERFANDDVIAIVHQIVEYVRSLGETDSAPPVVIASVNGGVADRIERGLRDQLKSSVYRLGDDLPVPIGTQLDPETITGVDRLLNAAAAYDALKQACVVVDFGTAITVDFVDGKGVFHGGAIAPGARLQLRALHEHTSALPEVAFARPGETFGRSTAQAMLQGVFHGIRGLVWKLVERYAEEYGAFPPVIATGGDAEELCAGDELFDRVVPDLTLRGIALAVDVALRDPESQT